MNLIAILLATIIMFFLGPKIIKAVSWAFEEWQDILSEILK